MTGVPGPRAAIAGVGLTHQARSIDSTTIEICLEASQLALDDAGFTISEVDGIAARWPGPGGTVFEPGAWDWTGIYGKPFRWICDTYPQGVPGVMDAAAAVSAGLCDVVLVVGGQAGVLGGPAVASYTRPDNEFVSVWGMLTAAHFALVAQVYFDRFHPDRDRLSEIAAAIRNAGSNNPAAVMVGRGPYHAEDITDSPMITEPFHLLDLCLATEGASAVIVTSPERAADSAGGPVEILGGASEWYRQQYVDPARYDEVGRVGADAYERALAQAGITTSDIDVFELYDINTWEVVRQVETLGLCAEGEGVDFLHEQGIGVEGGIPINTDGGLMSFSHTGFGGPNLKVVEAVRQLRGDAGVGQVKGAEIAFLTGAGSGAQYHNAMVLGRPR
ncbi:MAG: thiolase family protein [Acidimicrobiales bacterium]